MRKQWQDRTEQYFELAPGTVQAETSFRQELGLDEIDCFEIVTMFEQANQVELPDEVAETIDSIAQLCDWYLNQN